MTPEKKIQNAIIKYLKEMQDKGEPIFYERRQAGGLSYKKGIPDLYAVVNGQHLEIEVKKVGGELSPMQEKFRDKCCERCILWMCATNVEDVKRQVQWMLI